MDWLTNGLAILIGFLLRLAIPIALTILVVGLLKLLDERWERVARGEQIPAGIAKNIGCWIINNCSEEQRSGCLAAANPDRPCWQIFRGPDGRLQERCLACAIFRRSPIPIT